MSSFRDDRRKRERSYERDSGRDRHRDRDRDRDVRRGGGGGGDYGRRRSRSRSPRRGDRDRDGRDSHDPGRSRYDDRRDRDRDRDRDRRYDRRPDDRRDAGRRDDKDKDKDKDAERDRSRRSPTEPEHGKPRDDTTSPHGGRVPPPRISKADIDPNMASNASPTPEDGEEMDAVNDDDVAMMAMMGFGGFDTTKGKPVTGNQEGGVNIKKQRTWRQYMNRRGGFNRPLDKIK